jgi:hypothetical protein
MKTYFGDAKHGLVLAGTLFLASTAFDCMAVEHQIQQSYEIGPEGKLIMEVDRGSVRVRAVEGNRLDVKLVRWLSWTRRSQAEEIFREHKVEMTQEGSEVRIRTGFEPRRPLFGRWKRLQARYTISVPRQTAVEIKTAGGTVDIAGLEASARVSSSGGSMQFAGIGGPVWARTSGGSITVDGCGGDVDVETLGGSLTLIEIHGGVTGRTSGGSVKVGRVAGDVSVQTSGGSIRLNDVGGGIHAATSGGSMSARLTTQPEGDCNLQTSGGGIEVLLGEGIAVNLDAATSGGWVVADLPEIAPGSQRTRELQTPINGGGPALHLRTQGGNVRVKTF